jgi:RNA polymerase sigma factor (sigma-70 family)
MLSYNRLAQRATKGDRRAFAAIFRRYHQSLYRYCMAILGSPEDAQDALQNTMVKMLRALPGEERKIELKPWLYRIAHNESIELLRRRRETRELDPEQATPGAGLVQEVASRERLRLLLSDLDQLPERQRGALVMRELGGLDFPEIGAALGTSSAVIRQTVYEARLSLRQMDVGREMSCETVTRALSDGDGRVTRRRDVRAHLRSCANCRRFGEEIDARQRDFAVLAPLPAVVAARLLHSLLGGHGAGGGLAGALGGGAAKSIGVSTALKGAATVAVVAAIGVTAADRGGLIDAGLPGGHGSPATRTQQPADAGGRSVQQTGSPTAGVQEGVAAEPSDESLGSSRATGNAAGTAVSPGATKTTGEVPAASSVPAAHPQGRGREKQHPSASTHGQQTAATHKTAAHGPAATKSHPAHPPKPPHPAHPSKSSSAKAPAPSPSGTAPHEAHSKQAPTAPIEEAPAGHETGKKP